MTIATLFRRGPLKGVLCLALAFALATSASAGDVQVQLHPGEAVATYAFGDIAQDSFWIDSFGPDGDEEGTCMNRGASFRFMEALSGFWEDDVLRPYDVQFEMGWPFGCSARLYGSYSPYAWDTVSEDYALVVDEEGKDVVREGPFHMEDLFYAAALPSSMEDSSFFSARATILSTGEVFDLRLAETAFPAGYFEARSQAVALAADPGLNHLDAEQQALYDRYLELHDDVLDGLASGGDLVVVTPSTIVANRTLSFIDSQILRFQKEEGGAVETLDMEETCLEEEQGATVFCLCQATAFRVAQMASGLWTDGVFRSWDVAVETGWNTEGPTELLVDKMGLERLSCGVGGTSTAMEELTVDDAWYRVTRLSTGTSVTFAARENYLGRTFLALRSRSKKGTATAEEKATLKVLKEETVRKARALPFTGRFHIREEAKPLRAETILYSNVLDYLDGSGRTASLDIARSAREDDGKVCLCQAAAFRISQMMASVWSDGIFHPEDVTVETGWNTEGPEEFWVDQMGLAAGDVRLASGATPSDDLTLADAWYRLTLKSTGETFLFRATDRYYRSNFLDLRSKNKKGTLTEAERARMQTIRAAMAQDVFERPCVAFFSVAETIDYPAPLPVARVGDRPVLPDRAMADDLSDGDLIASIGGGTVLRRLHYAVDVDGGQALFSVDVDGENRHVLLGRTASGQIEVVAQGGTTLRATLTEGADLDAETARPGIQSDLYLISVGERTGGDSSGGCSLAAAFEPSVLLLVLPLLVAAGKR